MFARPAMGESRRWPSELNKKDLTGCRRIDKKTEVAILGVAISEPFLRRKEKRLESYVFLLVLQLLTESYVF